MADDPIITEQPSEAEQRIKQLSKKLSLSAEEAAEKDKALAEQTSKFAELQREKDFYASFSDLVTTNPAAKDHKDEILAKVKSGLTTEDATFAVLGKAGKLGVPKEVEVHRPIAGGSATNSLPQGGTSKAVSEMSRDEKRAALLEAEKRGDIGLA